MKELGNLKQTAQVYLRLAFHMIIVSLRSPWHWPGILHWYWHKRKFTHIIYLHNKNRAFGWTGNNSVSIFESFKRNKTNSYILGYNYKYHLKSLSVLVFYVEIFKMVVEKGEISKKLLSHFSLRSGKHK